MSQLQRWSQPPGVFMTTEPDGEYVTHADHVADRAELVRLLKVFYEASTHYQNEDGNRQREIADVEEEIAWLNEASDWARDTPEQKRILAREQAALEALQKGLRK